MSASFPSELRRYLHTIEDIRQIAEGWGIVRLYHGMPFLYARSFVRALKQDTLTSLFTSSEQIGRMIARVYGIPYTTFTHRTTAGSIIESYAGSEVHRLSTAPVAIAWRFATTFQYGEVASQLNEDARLYVEARRMGISYDALRDRIDEELDRRGDKRTIPPVGYVIPTDLADKLGLPDRLGDYAGGAVIEVWVEARNISAGLRTIARRILEWSGREATDHWNTEYHDIKIEHRKIRDARIIWVTPGVMLDG